MHQSKLIGLILAAVLAICALTASAAQAEGVFMAGEYPSSLSGSQTETNEFEVQGQKLTCSTANFSASISASSAQLEVTPSYSGCKAFGFVNAVVELNGCKYVYTVEQTRPGGTEDEWTGGFHIVCPAGKEITITAATCTVHIPEQTPTTDNVDYKVLTEKPERVTFRGTLEGIHSKVTSGFLCPLTAKETDISGKWLGEFILAIPGANFTIVH